MQTRFLVALAVLWFPLALEAETSLPFNPQDGETVVFLGDSITHQCLYTEFLKWKLPSDGRLGYALTKAGHKLSADRLKVTGLEPGQYEVLIDGQAIGQWSHIALGTKIEIQENEATPQFQQAPQVALLNQQRNDEVVRPLRDRWGRVKGLRRQFAQGTKGVEERLAQAKAGISELRTKETERLTAIYEAAQPVERTWIIRRVKS